MSKIRYKMSSFGAFLILLILVEIPTSECVELTPGDKRVKFEKLEDTFYELTIDENIENVVLFNVIEAAGEIRVEYDDACPELSNRASYADSQYSLNKALDYENYNQCQEAKHKVVDQNGGKSLIFIVKVENLDDNPPTFLVNSNCELHENTQYTLENTTCTLTMEDADGMMEGPILKILDPDYSEIFGVSFRPVLTDKNAADKSATVAIFLQGKRTLDYETKNSHVFVVNAQEKNTSGKVQVVINVVDEPDTPPKFTKMFTTQQFEENKDQKFFVSAQDGDIGINSPILYGISENGCEKFKCDIKISEDGEINVKNVDREETGNTITLRIEAKETDDDSSTTLDVTFFIIDQDDNVPKIKTEKSEISVNEGIRGNIIDFSVEDMDLSENGTFSIELHSGNSQVDYTKAFEVIPNSGYQSATFLITVIDSSALNYEDTDWKVISFNIVAIEKADAEHRHSLPITIKLIDINDEPPIFLNDPDSVKIPEDIKAGEMVFNATAADRDEGDIISYEIVGVWNQKLEISDEGIITTKTDNVFNYELLQQVLIAVKASDKGQTHTATETLTINVQDVDDEPPVMTIDVSTEDKMVKIPENSVAGTVLIGVTIRVTDPDTKPKLKLEINWQNSYVTKNSGLKKFADSEWQCFEVDTSSEERQTINRKISINRNCSPDFEKFDSIVLFFTATDENTVIGEKSTHGTILINIVDLNDNIPEFIDSSLNDLSVTDGTKTEAKIGIIAAKDDDMGEKLRFSIKPVENEPDWVDIDENSGQLTVKKGVTIDCDEPKRDTINYYVTVHDPDPKHINTTKVAIHIVDINDEDPHIKWKTAEVEIPEKSKDIVVSALDSIDADRDDPFNKVVFKFETNITGNAANIFKISEDGQISIELRNGASLDRDAGPGKYTLPILAYDNPKGTLQLKDHFDLTVTLKDLDDNIPKLQNKALSCTENMKKGAILGDLVAIDPDEDGPNSDVSFVLKECVPLSHDSKYELNGTFFEIRKSGAKTATISMLKSLRGFWGEFNLIVRTSDAGNPTAYLDNNIQLSVEKFNFEQPVFDFPKTDDDRTIIVDKDDTTAKTTMILYNGEMLKNLNVNDLQDHKWDVTYEIKDEDGGEANIFRIIQASTCSWEGILQLQRSLSPEELSKDHTVTINAKVKNDMKEGEAQVFVETTMVVKFFSTSEQPQFDGSKPVVLVEENSLDPKAIPVNATFSVKNMKPYYFILHPSDTFKIIPENGTIELKQPLDYELQNEYSFKIIARNKNIVPTDPPEEGGNILDVTVKVEDMNDHPPVFTPRRFTGAFLRTYKKGTTIVTVNATDADPTLQRLKFSLGNFECSESLKAPEVPFVIGSSDGKISNQFTVTSDMSGYCGFIVLVEDQADKNGTVNKVTTTVQINIISDNELVKFTFFNNDGFINENIDHITTLIDEALQDYHYKSFLADLTYDDTWRNTTANFFFINSNEEPVPSNEILGNLSDPIKYAALSKTLATIHVQLYYFSYNTDPKVVEDYLKIWLIVAIVILGSLLTLITITFFFRSRALTRRINNLSTTKFGSQDSGLNRAGITAPTTNRNAIEGSNPVFNSESYIKEMEDDTNSVLSGDSDLLGIENNPDFDI